jgi:MFS family permease
VCVSVTALPAGILSERWGRRSLSLVACALTCLGVVLLGLAREVSDLWVFGGLIGLGMGIFSSVNWAWATDLVPSAQAGKYLGLTNLATAGSAALSRLLGPFIDLLNGHTANAGYSWLFVLAALGAVLGFVTTLRIRETRHAPRIPQLPAWTLVDVAKRYLPPD